MIGARLIVIAFAAAMLAAPSVGAQVAHAAHRAPRFLLASTGSTSPVPIDPARSPILRKRLSLELDGTTVREALASIGRQAGTAIWYSPDVIPAGARVRLSARDITVAAALTDVLLDAEVDVVMANDGSASIVKRAPVPVRAVPEVVRGRVTDDSGRVAPGTMVRVTRGPDRLTLTASIDSAGYYRAQFDSGTGDYLVYASALGYVSARRRVQRLGSERELVANFTLARDMALLAAVKVVTVKPERASKRVDAAEPETGSNEHWAGGVMGQLGPTVVGDLNALAGTMAGVTMTATGPSILGSGSESNLTTLNGMALPAGSIPRAASTSTRVTGATFDATRGGFAGANIDVQLAPGDRFYQHRNVFVALDPPQLQYVDAVSRALGTTSGGVRGSAGADGELIRHKLTYNVALDLSRSASDPASLVSADADALLHAGVSPDSVARLIAVATPLGLPLSGQGMPRNSERTGITWLGRLDDTRDTLQTRALTSYVGYTKEGALGLSPLVAPSSAGERRDRTVGAQLTLGAFVGPGKRVLTETRIAASAVRSSVEPYRALPAANVLLRSSIGDTANDITSITIGGSPLVTDDERWTIEGANETGWNARGRRHRFKAIVWGRADGLRQEGASNALGSYAFNSIADLAVGRASSYTRTLAQPVREGRVWNAATALSHTYGPSRYFSFIYGARLEADGFLDRPARNSALETALGVRGGAPGARVHVSPRVGFTYTYNRHRENYTAMWGSNVGQFIRNPTGTLRGGIGEFRDLLRPGLLADASASTGLAGGTSILSCVGAAVPQPDWSDLGAGAAPTECLGGGGVLAERAPAVTLIGERYDVPRSWRSSLDWSSTVGKWIVRAGGLASYDLNQPGVIDANFSGVQRFTLAADGSRPVYVGTAAIDPLSGAVSASESRQSATFGRVVTRVSDLRGYGGQLTFGVSPDLAKFRNRYQLFASANYSLQSSRRQYRGFDGAGFGDPRAMEWAPAQNDARHVAVLTGGISSPRIGTITLFGRAQSGLPFTPVVQGDVNGDGRGFDRAFVPDPDTESDPLVANQLRAMLAAGSSSARRCLANHLGTVAERNGCRGPWTQTLNMLWRPPIPARWRGKVSPNVYLQNVLAGVDQLVHGSESLRGWGSPASPDPVLFVPRGFDVASSRFRYDVNPRFADTRPNRALMRDPFRVVIDFRVDLTTSRPLQQLRRAVEPVRSAGVLRRRSADSLTAFYLRQTSSVYGALLLQSDSLLLTNAQIAALRQRDSVFAERVIGVYRPLGEFLAAGAGAAGRAELDSARATDRAYWKIFWEQPLMADSIITPLQKELFPLLTNMVEMVRRGPGSAQFRFGSPVRLATPPASQSPAGASDNPSRSEHPPRRRAP